MVSVPHDIWDLHAESGRWWIVTNPTNLYSQDDFKSRDVVLTFHVGLVLRMMSREEVPISESAAALLPGAWRRWDQAVEAPAERSGSRGLPGHRHAPTGVLGFVCCGDR